MLEGFKALLLITIAISLWTAFLLLNDKRGYRRLNLWFAAFLVALSAPQLDLYTSLLPTGGIYYLSLVASTFLWLKGPFVFTFIKVLCREASNFRAVWVHFTPWALAFISLFAFPDQFMLIVKLGMAHMVTYLIFSLAKLTRKRSYITSVWTGFRNSAYYWLLYVIAGVLLLVSIDFTVMTLVITGHLHGYGILDFYVFPIFSIFVLSIGVLSVFRPEVAFSESAENMAASLPAPQMEPENAKERQLHLDSSIANTALESLKQLMDKEKIFTKNGLSLPDLSHLLGLSTHQVSELLNVHHGQNFYDFVNTYRLTYACELLSNPDCELRILDIAFEAGFNSRNAFYRAFKSATGVTPSEFREQSRSNALA